MTKHYAIHPLTILLMVGLFHIVLICAWIGARRKRAMSPSQREGFDTADELQGGELSKVEATPSPIAIVSMMKNPKNIDVWLAHHRTMGIARFYIRLEDTPSLEEYLAEQSDVVVWTGKSTGKNEYTNIQHRQQDAVSHALTLAAQDKMDWIIHIDADELLAGGEEGLQEVRSLPDNVRVFWMQNVEAKFATIPRTTDQCFQAATFVNCSLRPADCASYGNGKGGGRVALDVSFHGPHRFTTSKSNTAEPKLSKLTVQHYESCDFDVYKAKYQALSVQDIDEKIPFSYYKESVAAAKLGGDEGDEALKQVFIKYRVAPDNRNNA